MHAPTPGRRWHRRALAKLATVLTVVFVTTIVMSVWILRPIMHPTEWYAPRPTVTSVIDGDTIDVRIGRRTVRVRLIGIDTPETKDPRRPVQCFGREASERTAELLPRGTIVALELDREEVDAFGRTLAYVHRELDGLFVNLELARGGFADVLPIAPNTAHADVLRAAVDEAERLGLGLWGACGGPGRPAD